MKQGSSKKTTTASSSTRTVFKSSNNTSCRRLGLAHPPPPPPFPPMVHNTPSPSQSPLPPNPLPPLPPPMNRTTPAKSNAHAGLANLGNTCFLNSVIQVLAHTPEFQQVIDVVPDIVSTTTANVNQLLTYECKELLRMMSEKSNQLIAPNRFVQVVQLVSRVKGNAVFSEYAQNDVSEFLVFLFDCIHTALAKPAQVKINGRVENRIDEIATQCYEAVRDTYATGYSQIYAKFYGMSFIEIVAKDAPTVVLSRKFEHYFMIDLSLPPPEVKEPTLYDCLDHYVSPELLEGENAWYNEATNQKQDVFKRTAFWNFPAVLIINLKRYKDIVRKDQRFVHCPVTAELNLSKYSVSYNRPNYRYQLYGVCNHSGGSIRGGHYTACVTPVGQASWYQCNDTLVTPIPEKYVVSNQTSCLFYRRIHG